MINTDNMSELRRDIIALNSLITGVINSSVKSKSIYSSDPKKCAFNLCIFSLNSGLTLQSATKAFERYNFDLLYGPIDAYIPGAVFSWKDYFAQRFEALRLKYAGKNNKLLTLIFAGAIENTIPRGKMVIASKDNQPIEASEIAYVLKTITEKVLKNATKNAMTLKTVARNYFMCKAYRDAYAKKTKRKLTPHKLAAITALLVEYGFISKVNCSAKGHYKANMWGIGSNNPYYERLPKPVAA